MSVHTSQSYVFNNVFSEYIWVLHLLHLLIVFGWKFKHVDISEGSSMTSIHSLVFIPWCFSICQSTQDCHNQFSLVEPLSRCTILRSHCYVDPKGSILSYYCILQFTKKVFHTSLNLPIPSNLTFSKRYLKHVSMMNCEQCYRNSFSIWITLHC